MRKPNVRRLVAIAFLLALSATTLACDFTVRDIGFVNLRGPRYAVLVVGPQMAGDTSEIDAPDIAPAKFDAAQTQLLANWNIDFASGSRAEARLGDAQGAQSQPATEPWTIWLVDFYGRRLLLEQAASYSALPPIEAVVEKHFSTPRMRELSESSLGSFAQMILFDGQAASRIEDASAAAAALKDLEPMLPRPVTLPVNVIVIPPSEREREHVLLWAMGADDLSDEDAALGVIYGRGRLAGPLLVNDSIQLRNSIAQLALVGESCECETDRSWIDEREIPFFWTEAESQLAEKSLGFHPGKSHVLAEIERVIARGTRSSRPSEAGDQIQRIVTGYLESEIVPGEPALVTIPPGRKHVPVGATVIAGEGWDFEPSGSEASDASDQAAESSAVESSEAVAPPSVDAEGITHAATQPLSQSSRTTWPWYLFAALGLIIIVSLGMRAVRRTVN